MTINVTFLIGLPGSGKSTFVHRNTIKDNLVVASTDNIIERYAAQLGKTYDEVFRDYIKPAEVEFFETIEAAVVNGQNIVIDRTNMNAKTRKRLISFVTNLTTDVVFAAVVFNPSAIRWLRQVTGRPGKTIPFSVLESMAKTFEYPSYEEGFSVIHDQSNLEELN